VRALRSTVSTAGMHEAVTVPQDPHSVHTVAHELSRLVGRDGAAELIRRTTAQLGVTPLESRLLVRAAADGTLDVPAVAEAARLEEERMREACRALQGRGPVTGSADRTGLTREGAAAVDALANARRAALHDLAGECATGEHPELAAFIERLSEDLVAEPTRGQG
jgi:hypothetical protein